MTPHKQKILLLDNGREWGGGTNSMLELLKRIDRNQFDITCCFYHNYSRGNDETIEQTLGSLAIPVTFIPQRRQPLWAKISKEIVRTLLFFSKERRKKAVHVVDRRWRIIPNAHKIGELLQAGQFDLLYMNNQPSTNTEGYLAARPLEIPVVQHCRIDPMLNRQLVTMLNRDCKAIICVSHGVSHTLQRHGVHYHLCHTVSNAIDIHQPLPDRTAVRQALQIAPETFVFGSIGSLIARKANHHTLSALGRFHRLYPHADWKMLIVGAGPEQANLAQLAEKEQIADRIVFTGFKNNALDFLAAFDAFILASQSEGLPRVVLEAMLVNTAVIGSRVTGTAELIEHNQTGLLFEYGDIAQLTQQLIALWENKELRQKLTDTAAGKVREHYAIDNYIQGVETVLANVIQEKSHA